MKKIVLIVLACFILTGCQKTEAAHNDNAEEKEKIQVVGSYLENSAAGNWPEAYKTLAGEALTEAKANAGRVKGGEKIVSAEFKTAEVCEDIADVTADIVKSSGQEFDRVAYKFRLIKSGNGWLIYKVSYGDYLHGELEKGPLPAEAAKVIIDYIEMPFTEKREKGRTYFAGKLRAESIKAEALPVDMKTVKKEAGITTKVIGIQCLGISKNYLVVRADMEVSGEGKKAPVSSIIDMVHVNGSWKISSLDIARN